MEQNNECPMENDDAEMPLTLPTQNADNLCFEQSQGCQSSEHILEIWGRLCALIPGLQPGVELGKDEYVLGRAASCDVTFGEPGIKKAYLDVISSHHLRITRHYCSSKSSSTDTSTDFYVCVEDLSRNGTFVNGNAVGKGQRVVLETNDVISLAVPQFRVYSYMSTRAFEGAPLPAELRSKYAISRTLGSGVCGEVKLAFSKVGGNRFAMKTIAKKNSDSDKIMNEVRILKALRHPHIIRMEDIVDTPSTIYIILELMEGGELFDRISQANGLEEKVAKLIFYQIVLAVNYLHQLGITHRDLKPENILLASDAQLPLVKVSDFGLSKHVHTETSMRTFCGTPMYVAPEVLITSGRGTYTSQVDVWSLGVILYVSLSGRVPFTTHNGTLLQNQIIKGYYKFPSSSFNRVSKRAVDLIQRMLITDPKKRYTMKQVLLHPWLQDREMRNRVDQIVKCHNGVVDTENHAPQKEMAAPSAASSSSSASTVSVKSNQNHVFGAPIPPLAKRPRRE